MKSLFTGWGVHIWETSIAIGHFNVGSKSCLVCSSTVHVLLYKELLIIRIIWVPMNSSY